MHATSSKLGSSGCLLSTFSSYRRWVHHVAATVPQQQKRLKSSWVVGVPMRFVGLRGSIPTLRIAPAQLSARRRLVVALSDNNGSGSTNADGKCASSLTIFVFRKISN